MEKVMEEYLFITLMLRRQASDLMLIGLLKVAQRLSIRGISKILTRRNSNSYHLKYSNLLITQNINL